MVDPPGAETHLGDLEAATLTEQDVLVGHAHVVEPDVHVTVRGVVLAEHLHAFEDLDTGRVGRHEDLRLAQVRRPVGAGLHHGDHDLAARVAGTGDVVLLAGDHPLVAVAHRSARDVLGIRRSEIGFGHGVGGTDLAVEERLQPLLLLFGGADSFEHLHVAGVGCCAVHRLRCEWVLAQLHGDVRVVEVREAFTGFGVGEEEVPEALLLGLVLHRLEQFELPFAIAPVIGPADAASLELGGDRFDLGEDELLHGVVERADAFGHTQVVHLWGGFERWHGFSSCRADVPNLLIVR